jgi:hypothetical protein
MSDSDDNVMGVVDDENGKDTNHTAVVDIT